MAVAAVHTPALTRGDRLVLRLAVALESAVAARVQRRAERAAGRADVMAGAHEQCAVRAHLLGIRR